MKCQRLFSGKNKKTKISVYRLLNLPMVKVNGRWFVSMILGQEK